MQDPGLTDPADDRLAEELPPSTDASARSRRHDQPESPTIRSRHTEKSAVAVLDGCPPGQPDVAQTGTGRRFSQTPPSSGRSGPARGATVGDQEDHVATSIRSPAIVDDPKYTLRDRGELCDMSSVATWNTLHQTADWTTPQVNRNADAFCSLFDRSGTCMCVVDVMLRIREINDQFRRELPGAGDLVGRNLLDFAQTSTSAHLRHQFARLAARQRERLVERITWLHTGQPCATGTLSAVAVHGDVPIVSDIIVSIAWDQPRPDDGLDRKRRRLLTDLDARILEGIASGMSTVSLANKLYLSRQGVEYHVGVMLKKLKAPNRAALVSRAYAMGVLSPTTWPPKVDIAFVK